MTADPDYGPAIAALLDPPRKMPLDAGRPNETARPSLDVPTASLFAELVRNAGMAAGCHAALWLRHDFLPESHVISQGIDTAEGCYWHGIMHRREGNFGNAKYWLGQVGQHPVSTALLSSIGQNIPARARDLAAAGAWGGAAFVDLCEVAARGNSDLRAFCEDVQEREWNLLFAHCFERV